MVKAFVRLLLKFIAAVRRFDREYGCSEQVKYIFEVFLWFYLGVEYMISVSLVILIGKYLTKNEALLNILLPTFKLIIRLITSYYIFCELCGVYERGWRAFL